MNRQQEIEDLRERLSSLMAEEAADLRERQREVQPWYKFTLEPHVDTWHDVFDPQCRLYRLMGRLQNADELRKVGKVVPTESAGMTYLWNGATNHFVVAIGGGTIFAKDRQTWDDLSTFIVQNPEGGDVTGLVNRERLGL